MKAPKECPYEDCHSEWFKTHQQRRDKALRDTKYNQVEVYRRECLRCNRTHRVYPQGASNAQQSDRLKGLSVLLYLLEISYRGVEEALTARGFYLSHATVWRTVQTAGAKARQLRHTWLQHTGGVRAARRDLTYVRCKGQEVLVGLAVHAQQGITLGITVLRSQDTDTLTTWLWPLLELTGAEVLITDDSNGFKEIAHEGKVDHQVCRRHVT